MSIPTTANITPSSPNKILFPAAGITKQQLFSYYSRIYPLIQPHIAKRPLALQRFPQGVAHKGFFQKNMPTHTPDWIPVTLITNADKSITRYITINSLQALQYLANQDVITLHAWLSTTTALNEPDRLVFDLDPQPEATMHDICFGAIAAKKKLEAYGFVAYVLLTGKRGVHVTCPLKPQVLFDHVRSAARVIAAELCKQYPQLFSCQARKEKRSAKLYIDIMRNSWAQTCVAPYSVRATPRASIATPITWDELKRSHTKSDMYTIVNIFKRMARVTDPWKSMEQRAIVIPPQLYTS